MAAFLKGIAGFAVAIAVVVFALANRGAVGVIWSPVHSPAELPVFSLVLVSLLIGFIAGGGMVWLNDMPLRRDRRRQKKRIAGLEKKMKENDDARALRALPGNEDHDEGK